MSALNFDERLERLLKSISQNQAECEAFLATQPSSRLCEKHGLACKLSVECSFKDRNSSEWVPAYEPCPACLAEDRREKAFQKFRKRGIPGKLLGATLGDLKYDTEVCRDALRACVEFEANPRGFLILLGLVGNGKSHIAASIIQSYGKGLFIRQCDFLRQLRDRYNNPYLPDIRDRCESTPLLVIDDCGLSGGGKDEMPALYAVLDSRYSEHLPTILTANLTWEELCHLFGDRLADRFKEAAFGIFVFNEESKRKQRRPVYLSRGQM